MAVPDWKKNIELYAQSINVKFSALTAGEPEDQLRSPFEQLLISAGSLAGISVVPVGETLLSAGVGKPDYGIECDGLLCGHIELKAPGKGADTSRYRGHDKRQADRFAELPNIIYSDGQDFALYRQGQLEKRVQLSGNPVTLGSAAVSDEDARQIEALFTTFFRWEPVVPGSSKQLAQFLAPLCRMLRDDVLDALSNNVGAVRAAAQDWRRYLFPGADDVRFADAYAQTVIFSLLLARSNGSDTLILDEAIASLTHANTLLSRALQVLTDPLVKEHLNASLGMLQRVIDRVPTGTMSGGRRDPWLHFYEDFLAEYDPKLRKDAGAYYTPVEVVQAQVRLVDDLLRKKLNKQHGFATGGVNVIDPAVGTGTYLLGVVEHVMEEVERSEGVGAVPARADLLASHLFGFEIMVGPYAVATLRLTRMLQQYGGHPPADGVQVMLNNTMESPYETMPELPLLYRPIGLEHKRAKRVKESVPVLVCLGNPPYDRHEAATASNRAMTGGWVRWGETTDGRDAILQDFIRPVREAGKGSTLKNLYNLYVYFWRWALWKTFEHDLAQGPGVVTYITASSFLDGDAFIGMRKHMRRVCDEIWFIDLGGEGRGTRQDENVFAIQTPVAITIAVRYGPAKHDVPAITHYACIEGSRNHKLSILEHLRSISELSFQDCPQDWAAPFKPAGKGNYFDWPLLTDLMPWQHSGSQLKRTWPHSPDRKALEKRWRAFLQSTDRAAAFSETRDRKISRTHASLDGTRGLPALRDLDVGAPCPTIVNYGFRSFDRQYLLLDNRLADYLRPPLWNSRSERQIFFTSQLTSVLGSGQAITATADVPDMHYFAGRGAKDILPLYRDKACQLPNLHPELLDTLSEKYESAVLPEDFAAYLYALTAHPGFTDRFHEDLSTKEFRVPITLSKALFDSASSLGKELLFLHTFGERFSEGQNWPEPVVRNIRSIETTSMPESYQYDEERELLIVGSGWFGPVSQNVYEYEVSGMKVVQKWLGYRMRNRRGRRSSPLDELTPETWPATYTSELIRLLNILTHSLELHPIQNNLLNEIVEGPLLAADALGDVPPNMRKAPDINEAQLALP